MDTTSYILASELPMSLTIYILVILFIFGTVFGSFVNCQAWRIAHNEPWHTGRSHCATCNHPLKAIDLIPIVSYIGLKGRCRYCGEKISPRYMITEIIMGCAFVGLYFTMDDLSVSSWLMLLRDLGLVVILLGISLVDLEIYEIPNGYILFGTIWWAVLTATSTFLNYHTLYTASAGLIEGGDSVLSLSITSTFARVGGNLLAGIVFGVVLLIISLVMDKILGKESFGGGDIKMIFMVTLYLGALNELFSLVLACIIGLLFVAVRKESRIPFGPSIAIATYLGLTVVPFFTQWYISLF